MQAIESSATDFNRTSAFTHTALKRFRVGARKPVAAGKLVQRPAVATVHNTPRPEVVVPLDFHRHYTHANVLSKPFPSDKKSFPVRWLIVVMSTLAAIFLAVIVAGTIENRNQRRIHAASQG